MLLAVLRLRRYRQEAAAGAHLQVSADEGYVDPDEEDVEEAPAPKSKSKPKTRKEPSSRDKRSQPKR